MHFATFLLSVCTALLSSMLVNQTSKRMTLAARGPESLSTRRRPVIMLAGSMVAPIMPSTRLFQYSSTCPPPTLGFNWNWKWPPVSFILSSTDIGLQLELEMAASLVHLVLPLRPDVLAEDHDCVDH